MKRVLVNRLTAVLLGAFLVGCGGGGGSKGDGSADATGKLDGGGTDVTTVDGTAADGPGDVSATPDTGGSTPDGGGVPTASDKYAFTIDGKMYSSTMAAGGVTGASDNAISASFPNILGPKSSLVWPGNAAGTFEETTLAVGMSFAEEKSTWNCGKYYANSLCKIVVTEYGTASGSKITGTFTATLVRSGGTAGSDTRVVTDGTFEFKHP